MLYSEISEIQMERPYGIIYGKNMPAAAGENFSGVVVFSIHLEQNLPNTLVNPLSESKKFTLFLTATC